MQCLNLLIFTVFYACVFQIAVKYSISDMLCCERAANSGVFASLALLVVANSCVLSLVGAENTVNHDVLEAVLNTY